MEIYLIRHGIAENYDEAGRAGLEDSERALTAEGAEKTANIARFLRKRVNSVDAIFHSPYLRASETAAIFYQEFPDSVLKELSYLRPSSPVIAAIPLLEECSSKYESVALVGHEPYMSTLASLLLTGKEMPILSFKKAGIANIKWQDANHCSLQFLLTPKMIL